MSIKYAERIMSGKHPDTPGTDLRTLWGPQRTPWVSGEGRQGVMGEKTHSEFYDQYTKVLGPLLLELHTSCRSESSFISLVHLDKTFC